MITVLDLRDLVKEWQEQLAEIESLKEADNEQDDEAAAELGEEIKKYADLCGELGVEPDPDALGWYGNNEPTMIHEDHFEEYAQELAEDLGSVPRELPWPLRCIDWEKAAELRCIDWEKAAEELKADYSVCEYDGETYYIRSW